MGLATLIFWLGTKHYVRQPPQRADQRRGISGQWCGTQSPIAANERAANDSSMSRWLDSAAEEVQAAQSRGWHPDDLRNGADVLGAVQQVNSTWVLQGKKMTPFYIARWRDDAIGRRDLVMIWVPILTLGVYPWLERRGILPTPLRRMSAGMVLGAVSFVICGCIQSRMDHGRDAERGVAARAVHRA